MSEPAFRATDAGATDAVRRGNRLRARSAATTLSGVGLLVAVAVVAPWQDRPGLDSLTPARDPVVPVAPRAEPTATSLPQAVPVGPAGSSAAAPSPAPTRGTPTGSPTPSVRATPRPAATSPITRGAGAFPQGDLCPDDPAGAAAGWCLRYTGPVTARRGHPVSLSQELCRLGTHPAATVTFRTTREALLSVSGGAADWRAGQGERYTEPGRTVTVAPGTCLTWSSSWDTRGADGFLVTPGTYDVQPGVEVSDLVLSPASAELRVTD